MVRVEHIADLKFYYYVLPSKILGDLGVVLVISCCSPVISTTSYLVSMKSRLVGYWILIVRASFTYLSS